MAAARSDPSLQALADYAWLLDMAAALAPAPEPDETGAENEGDAEPRAA